MTENTPAPQDGSGGPGYPSPPGCDPDLLDQLKCRADGIKAQAKYNDDHAAELKTARENYEKARVDYRTARESAQTKYDDLGKQLEKVLDQLRCLIDNPRTVHRLDEAFRRVQEELSECPGNSGCYLDDDCDFHDLATCRDDDVTGASTKIQDRIAAAKKVFDDLVKEPTRIPADVAKLDAEVQRIVNAMASDSRSLKFEQLYVQALVASSHRDALWRGFVDGNAYVDCLCRALLCQLKGHDAAAHLERRKAVLKCKAEAEETRCAWLRDHTDAAVMAEYERLVAEYGGYGDESGGDYPPQKPGGGDYPPQKPGGGDYPPQKPGGGHPPQKPGGDYGGGQKPGGDYPPQKPGGGDYPPQKPGGGDYPPQKPGGGDYPPQKPGGEYGGQGPGDDYPTPGSGDEDYGSEGYGSSEEGPGGEYGDQQDDDYQPPQSSGYGKGQPPDHGDGPEYPRRGARPGLRRPSG